MGFDSLLSNTIPVGFGIVFIVMFSLGILICLGLLIKLSRKPAWNNQNFWSTLGRKISIFLLSMGSLASIGLLLWSTLVGTFIGGNSVGLQEDGRIQGTGYYMAPPNGMVVLPLSDSCTVATEVPTSNGKPIDPDQDTLKFTVVYQVLDQSKLDTLYPHLRASGSFSGFVHYTMLPCLEDPGNHTLLEKKIGELGTLLRESGIEAHFKIRHSVTKRLEYDADSFEGINR